MSQTNHLVTIGRYHLARFTQNGESHIRCCRCPRRIKIGEQAFSHAPQSGHTCRYYCIPCAKEVHLL